MNCYLCDAADFEDDKAESINLPNPYLNLECFYFLCGLFSLRTVNVTL